MVQQKTCNHGDADMAGCPACDFYDTRKMHEEYRKIAVEEQAKILAIDKQFESKEAEDAEEKEKLLSRLRKATALKKDAEAAVRECEDRLANIRPLVSDAVKQQSELFDVSNVDQYVLRTYMNRRKPSHMG